MNHAVSVSSGTTKSKAVLATARPHHVEGAPFFTRATHFAAILIPLIAIQGVLQWLDYASAHPIPQNGMPSDGAGWLHLLMMALIVLGLGGAILMVAALNHFEDWETASQR